MRDYMRDYGEDLEPDGQVLCAQYVAFMLIGGLCLVAVLHLAGIDLAGLIRPYL